MNVTIESHILNHDRRSGLMTYTEGLVYGLSEHDRDNRYSLVYYSLTRDAAQMPGPKADNFSKVVLRVPDMPFSGRQTLVDGFLLPAHFRASKARVFHRVSGYTMPRDKKVFKVLTVHDLRTLTIGDNVWTQNIEHYRRTLNSLDACIVVSECTKQDLLKHFKMDERKIKVVHLGADKRFFPATQEQMNRVRNKYNIQGPFLLSIGSVPRKNIDGIIRAFAKSKAGRDHTMVLSCNQDIEKYQALAESCGVGPRVRILDKLQDDEVVALYSGCYGFIFPSLYEGFGLPILEAMHCGAPVVTSNSSSCPEVAGDAAILVDPNSTHEIAQGIDDVCFNHEKRQGMIARGRARVKLFSWDRHAEAIKNIYAEAL